MRGRHLQVVPRGPGLPVRWRCGATVSFRLVFVVVAVAIGLSVEPVAAVLQGRHGAAAGPLPARAQSHGTDTAASHAGDAGGGGRGAGGGAPVRYNNLDIQIVVHDDDDEDEPAVVVGGVGSGGGGGDLGGRRTTHGGGSSSGDDDVAARLRGRHSGGYGAGDGAVGGDGVGDAMGDRERGRRGVSSNDRTGRSAGQGGGRSGHKQTAKPKGGRGGSGGDSGGRGDGGEGSSDASRRLYRRRKPKSLHKQHAEAQRRLERRALLREPKPTFAPFPPFCNGTCEDPTTMYGPSSIFNLNGAANYISRETPDGVHEWPYSCVNGSACTQYNYKVEPVARWWDNFATSPSLPTNVWWTSFFSDPPYNTNPSGWVWPVYELPYTCMAQDFAFGMGMPVAQEEKGQPGIMQGMPQDANTTAPLLQIDTVTQGFLFTSAEPLIQYGLITDYDPTGLVVTLQYNQAPPNATRHSSSSSSSPSPSSSAGSSSSTGASSSASSGSGGSGTTASSGSSSSSSSSSSGNANSEATKSSGGGSGSGSGATRSSKYNKHSDTYGGNGGGGGGGGGGGNGGSNSGWNNKSGSAGGGLSAPTGTNGTMTVPVAKGSPYMTFVYEYLTPIVNVPFGYVYSVNGVPTSLSSSPVTEVPPVSIGGGIYVFDVQIWLTTLAYEYRFYTNSAANMTVSVPMSSDDMWHLDFPFCDTTCVYRVACTQNVYVDPTNPAPFYSDTANGGFFNVSVATLDAYANAFPTNAAVPGASLVGFDSVAGTNTTNVAFNWEVGCIAGTCTGDDLLMLALPHHLPLLTATDSTGTLLLEPSVSIPTMAGVAVGAVGANWAMNYSTDGVLNGVLSGDPFYSKTDWTANATVTATIAAQLAADLAAANGSAMNHSFVYADCYAFGKLVAGIARLALIADELGETAAAASARATVKLRLNQWFDPSITSFEYPYRVTERLIYDTIWGGVIPFDAIDAPGPFWQGPGAIQPEFGSGGYNDHLFHYGYYLYAVAAVIHSGEPDDIAWYLPLQKRFLATARDIANPNPSEDVYFTNYRYKSDWYAGHSWASGLYPSGDYPNIESTSEAINAWYSLYLLGYAMDEWGLGEDSLAGSLMDVGQLLLVTDIHSFSYYMHTYANWSSDSFPADRAYVYPEEFAQYGVVGNLWAAQTIYQTFFSWGICQSSEFPTYKDPGICSGLHLLNVSQIRYFNELFILAIQVLPFTPATNALIDTSWLDNSYNAPGLAYEWPNGTDSYGYSPEGIAEYVPDLYGKCNSAEPVDYALCQAWLPYSYQVLSMTGPEAKETAWEAVQSYNATDAGSTLTNTLWFIATQNFTATGSRGGW